MFFFTTENCLSIKLLYLTSNFKPKTFYLKYCNLILDYYLKLFSLMKTVLYFEYIKYFYVISLLYFPA